jgi:hypothetical protein
MNISQKKKKKNTDVVDCHCREKEGKKETTKVAYYVNKQLEKCQLLLFAGTHTLTDFIKARASHIRAYGASVQSRLRA